MVEQKGKEKSYIFLSFFFCFLSGFFLPEDLFEIWMRGHGVWWGREEGLARPDRLG
jgi:hypothetical protein